MKLSIPIFLKTKQNGSLSTLPRQLCFILLSEAVSLREKVPGSTLVLVPHQRFLPRVVVRVLLNQVLDEEEVVGQVVLLLHVGVEAMRVLVEVILPDPADETVVLQLVVHPLHLVTQGAKGVDDETLDDRQEDDDDQEEEGEVKEDPDVLVVVAIRRLYLVSDTTSGSHSFVEVEDEACEHVVTLGVGLALLLFRHVELAEEVEGDDRVHVADDGQQANSEDELLPVVGDGLQDDPEGRHAYGDVDQVGGKEEVVVVAEDGEDEVPELVLERVVREGYSSFPNLGQT